MAKSKVIVDYSANRYSDLEIKNRAETISENLLNNPAFQSLNQMANSVRAQAADFGSWIMKMPEGNKQVTLFKNQSRNILEDLLSGTAIKVQDLSNGDEKLILSAGFEVKRKPTPVGLLERPENVIAKAGPTRGSLEVSWNVVPNAYLYEVQYTEAPSTEDSKWLHTSNTKRKIVLDSLTRGKAYSIQVAAAGSDPGRVWSDAIISYVM